MSSFDFGSDQKRNCESVDLKGIATCWKHIGRFGERVILELIIEKMSISF